MRRLLGLMSLIIVVALAAPGCAACADDDSLLPPGVPVMLRGELLRVESDRVVIRPEEGRSFFGRDAEATELSTTQAPDPDSTESPDASSPTTTTDEQQSGAIETEIIFLEPIEVLIQGSTDRLNVAEKYEIEAYRAGTTHVAVFDDGCAGANTVKDFDGNAIGGWAVGKSTVLLLGMLVLLPLLAIIGVLWIVRRAVGRQDGPAYRL